MTKETEK